MSSTKMLVLEFLTDDSDTYSITVNPPKDDLTMEEVSDVMDTIIEKDVFLTSSAKHLSTAKGAHYKTTTIEELPFASEGE